jgi:hypothetical protein
MILNGVICCSLGTPQKRKSGQAFLECHPEYSPDWDDLMDFVECEEGKDYSNTLKQQRKFKKFKYEKWRSMRQSYLEPTSNILRPRRLCS